MFKTRLPELCNLFRLLKVVPPARALHSPPTHTGGSHTNGEDAISKLANIVTVSYVEAEKRVDDSLVQIWKLKFGHIAIICSDRPKDRAQGLFKILR